MFPKLIDIHAHLNFVGFGEDWREVTEKTLAENVWFTNIGADLPTSRRAVEILKDFPTGLFATVGLHPTEVGEVSEAEWAELAELAKNDRVVAIGECGLEYPRITNDQLPITNKEVERQKKIFRKQIELALKVDKPLMIHCRDAYADVYEILSEYKQKAGEKLRGNFHFFAGTLEDAKKFIDLGFTLSFTGVITFAQQYDEVIRWCPAEMIIAETDAPYVAPVPHRGKRNEPLCVAEVVKKMAELRGVSYDEMAKITVENARRVFQL